MLEEEITTQHSALNPLNIVPMQAGVPIVWAVSLFGCMIVAAVAGFIIFGSILALLLAAPFALIFVAVRIICSNSSDYMRIFSLRASCLIAKTFSRQADILTPRFNMARSDLLESLKREIIRCRN